MSKMSKTKDRLRTQTRALLDSLPDGDNPQAYKNLFKIIEKPSISLETTAALYDFGPAAYNIALMVKESGSVTKLLEDLANNNLFEELSGSEGYRAKMVNLIKSYIHVNFETVSDKRERDVRILAIEKDIKNRNESIKKQNELINTLTPGTAECLTAYQKLDAREKAKLIVIKKKSELTKNLGNLSSAFEPYADLTLHLGKSEFLEAALSNPEHLKAGYLNLMKFINLDAKDASRNQTFKDMIVEFTNLALEKPVRDQLKPLADQALIDQIFNLPTITPAVKQYHTLVRDLATDKDKFQNLFGALTEQPEKLSTYIGDLMEYINSPKILDMNNKESEEYKQATEKFNQSMVSLIDTIQPDVIAAAIPLVDDKLLENIFALPAFQTQEVNKQATTEKTEEIQAELKEAVGKLDPEQAKNIPEPKKTSKKEPESSTAKKPSPVFDKIIKTIEALAVNPNGCDSVRKAMEANPESLTKALKVLIGPPSKTAVGQILDNFCMSGKEVAEFLPKVINEKGLKAVSAYIKDPTTLNLVNIFYQTNTLGFAIDHYVQSLTKSLRKGKFTEKVINERQVSQGFNQVKGN